MGSVPPELSLDYRPKSCGFVPKTISDFMREVSMMGEASEKALMLDGFVKDLEDEMRKIDAFKRELPLCMLLLNNAIAALKEESMQRTPLKNAQPPQPILEDFMPLKKNNCDDDGGNEEDIAATIKKEKDSIKDNKKNWLSSVQLWNTDDHHHTTAATTTNPTIKIKRNEEDNPFQRACKSRAGAGAFMPFNGGLSLVTPGIKNPREDTGSSGSRTSCISKSVSSSAPTHIHSNIIRTAPLQQQPPQQQQPTSRKQRRCWSPELHRRFINALQQLGGSQVATPKQIREFMQVDGLTNDEVKSHLQKYRLHTRRGPPPANAAAAATTPANQSLVVLGSLWMSRDHRYGDSSKASSSQSGSPQGPLQLTGNTGGTSTTGGDSMDEDDEDAKSEGYSWKNRVHKPGKDDDDV